MNLEEKNFKKKQDTKIVIPQEKRDNVKKQLMVKYGISSNQAEKIICKLEDNYNFKVNTTPKYKQKIKNNNSSKDNIKKIEVDNGIPKSKNKYTQKNTEIKKYENNSNLNKNIPSSETFENKNKKINQDDLNKIKRTINTTSPDNNLSQNETSHNGNVDSLLEEILPDYNKQISIKADHVDLTFEVENEKIDTLKESFIRKIKRKKTKKIRIHVLKDISFRIYKGEKVGIIGYNGAGKSTLLKVITGIFPPDKGNVTTHGNISPLLSLGAGFDQNFSGRRNIILNGAVLGYDKEYLESKIDEIIEFSELEEFIDIPIKNYSSGMIAKLGFSIATTVNPDILIIDEILGVGDVNFQKKSADKIRSLMDGGTTVLLVSHSIPQIRELCDKAIWIDQGCLREIGEVNKVCDNYLKDAEKASREQLANIQLQE